MVLALAAGTLNYAGITWLSGLSSWTHHHFRPFPHAMPLDAHEIRGWPTSEVLQALSDLRQKSLSPSELDSFVESTRSLDDEAFVDAAYRAWLGRAPDPSGRKDLPREPCGADPRPVHWSRKVTCGFPRNATLRLHHLGLQAELRPRLLRFEEETPR